MTVQTQKEEMTDVVDATTIQSGRALVENMRDLMMKATADIETQFDQQRPSKGFLCAAANIVSRVVVLHWMYHLLQEATNRNMDNPRFWPWLIGTLEDISTLAHLFDFLDNMDEVSNEQFAILSAKLIKRAISLEQLRDQVPLSDRITAACQAWKEAMSTY